MATTYDPYDLELRADPYPVYARLRATAPVYYNENLELWALSRYADVRPALRDYQRFSSSEGISIQPAASGPKAYRFASLIAMDPPHHSRIRRLVINFFSARRMAMQEVSIRKIVRRHLESVLDHGEFDFVADFVRKVPMDVLSALMGVPESDWQEVRRLADLAVERHPGMRDIPPSAIEASMALVAYYADLVEERRGRRRGDLISHLLDATNGDERLRHDELVAFLSTITGAGNDTVLHLVASAWFWAWRHPDQQKIAFDGAIQPWIEETLRYDTPTQFVARTTLTPVRIDGELIPEGHRVVLLIGAANRDPATFPEPDRYDLRRDTSSVISFGNGRHTCLGTSLARLEARIVLEETINYIRSYEIDEPRIRRTAAPELRGFDSMPMLVTSRR